MCACVTVVTICTCTSQFSCFQKMSSQEFCDEYTAWEYKIEQYNRGNGPPLITKKARLILATVQNDVETIKELLDSPKWYNVRDSFGSNLLHISICMASHDVFDYLLSVDFPLDLPVGVAGTALVISLNPVYVRTIMVGERFPFQLIRSGADINKISNNGDSLLHCALKCQFSSVARLLIEKGADVNARNLGWTPLDVCLNVLESYYAWTPAFLNEIIPMLLCYGADPSLCSDSYFSKLIVRYLSSNLDILIVENLVYHAFDEWRPFEIDGNCLLKIAMKAKSLFFNEIIELISDEIPITNHNDACHHLFRIDLEYLEILLEKHPNFIREILQGFSDTFFDLNLKTLDVLIQSSVKSEAIEFISNVMFFMLPLRNVTSTHEVIEILYYLLSYGMPLHELDLGKIYEWTGYSQEFKNLLLMDVEKLDGKEITQIMPRLICDVTFDLHEAVTDASFCNSIDWKELFNYSVHPKIQKAYDTQDRQIIDRQLPQIPLLQELARDTFRKHFVQVFEITTAKQFYSLIKLLPVNSVYKKIITFESKLYYYN